MCSEPEGYKMMQKTENEKKAWKYCVIGNVVKTHVDDNGVLRYGTSSFAGGKKVYLCGVFWDFSRDTIPVIGLCRGKRYLVQDVPVNLIENVRCSRAYNPAVLEIMNNFEFWDCWWGDSKEDKKATEEFVEKWKAQIT